MTCYTTDWFTPRMINFRDQLPYQLFSSPFVAGDKCSGPCAHGYRCPPSCKDLAKEIKKMHVYCHDYSDCYSNNCGIIYRQTMEQEQVTSGEHKSRFDFSYVDTRFVTFTFQRYPETVENSPQKSSSAPLPVYLFFHFIVGFQGLVFCNFNPGPKHLREHIYKTSFIFICYSGTYRKIDTWAMLQYLTRAISKCDCLWLTSSI